MEKKYRTLFEELKAEIDDTLENKNSDKYIEDFKTAFRARISEIHKKIDTKKVEIIELAVQAYNTNIAAETLKKEDEKKVTEETNIEVTKPVLTFGEKIKNLILSVDRMLEKNKIIEDTIQIFQESKTNELLLIKDDDFMFKPYRKLKVFCEGKVDLGLEWADSQNKPTNSDLDLTDKRLLNIHANSCYNYYITNKELTTESVVVEFETNICKTDAYFYFGVINEKVVRDSHCLCCNIANAYYIKSNGLVCINAVATNETNANFSQNQVHIISIRLQLQEKEIYFCINDKEIGPYKVDGERFTFTSGSCNSANGYIRILSSTVIG